MKEDHDAADSKNARPGMRKLLTLILLLLSVAAFIFGLVRGEPKTVYRTGAKICMECIGLG